MDLIQQAPAIRARAKSRWNPSSVDRAITEALRASWRIPSSMVALHDGEPIGLVRGDCLGEISTFVPITRRQWCGFTGYPDMDAEAKNGKITRIVWSKDTSGWNSSNQWADAWPTTGNPPSGAYSGTANTARQFDHTTVGGLWTRGVLPAASETKHLAAWSFAYVGSAAIRNVIIYDRVLTYEGAAISTTPTTLTNTLPALRYIGAGQDGLLMCVTATAALGATASALSALTLTDQLGNTAVAIGAGYTLNWFASAAAPSTTAPAFVVLPFDATNLITQTPFLPLPGGVSGVRKIEAFTSSVTNTGTVCLGLYKPVGTMWGRESMVNRQQLARSMFTLERIFDDACLSFLLAQSSSGVGTMQGKMEMVHG